MRLLLCWLVGGLLPVAVANAQPISADSSRQSSLPAVLRRGTYFYRQPGDPANVMRAGLDNMPVRTPDSTWTAVMPNAHLPEPNPPESEKIDLGKYLFPKPNHRKKER